MRRLLPGLLLAVFVPLLLSCNRAEKPYPAKTKAPEFTADSSVTIEDGGTLVRRLESEPKTLNFALSTLDYEKQVLSYLQDPLLDLDSTMKLIPALADSWEISPDGTTYTFHLHPSATFSDGKPVVAGDVVFTLRKLADPATEAAQYASLFEGLALDKTAAVDDTTVRVAFNHARASQLSAFNIPILPEHVYGKGDFRKDFNDTVVGTGPYRLASRAPGEIVLLRREDYWRKKPYLQRIVFRVIGDDGVAWNALKRGDIDEMIVSSDHWLYDSADPVIQKSIDIHKYYDLSYNFIPWNNRDPILADRRVRRALSMCLDQRSLINNLYHGTARIITGPFTPDQWAYNPDVPAIEYDIDGARRLLSTAGWMDRDHDGVLDRNGKPLQIEILIRAGNKPSADLAQIYQAGLRQAGVNMKIRTVDDATFWQRVVEGNFQTTALTWQLDIDPDPYAYFHSSQFPPAGQNFVFYSNPEADRLMEQGREEFDLAERTKIYHRLHEVLAADQPYTWTVQVAKKWGVNRRVRNVREANGLGLFLWYPGPLEWWIPAAERVHDR